MRRQLDVQEFVTAVSIDLEGVEVTKDDILSICCNFVVLDPELGVFRFAHLSVQEFLQNRTGFASAAVNALAVEICLTIC